MKPDNFLVEFLTETIPHYASDPTWRSTFHELANLSEEERTGMLQQLNTVPVSLLELEDEGQFPTIKAFLRLNLEDPAMPKMMIKLIDHENIRVQKISEQEGIA